MDLDKFASVDALAARFEKEQLVLDILVYNAGVLPTKYGQTADGWEPTYVFRVFYPSQGLTTLLA